jgi:hypothetical protein
MKSWTLAAVMVSVAALAACTTSSSSGGGDGGSGGSGGSGATTTASSSDASTGTTASATTATSATATTATSTSSGAGCDDTGVCGDSTMGCIACALEGNCAGQYGDCAADADCIAFSDCAGACADQACYDQCVTDHMTGADIYNTLLVCVICDECYNDCDGPGSGCP